MVGVRKTISLMNLEMLELKMGKLGLVGAGKG